MKYVREMAIILAISFAGEVMRRLIPLPIPASIYGLMFMYIGLLTGIIKLESVKAVSGMLLSVMQLMFIPAAVGLVDLGDVLGPVLVPAAVMIVVTTFGVMAAAGIVARMAMRGRSDE